jgi:hypothetical protein
VRQTMYEARFGDRSLKEVLRENRRRVQESMRRTCPTELKTMSESGVAETVLYPRSAGAGTCGTRRDR